MAVLGGAARAQCQDGSGRRACQAGAVKYALPGPRRRPPGRHRRGRAGPVGRGGGVGMSFAGRTAVITGASSGIGRALAKALAAKGARVGATARRADLLDGLAREVRAAGGTIEAATADVTDRAALGEAVRGLEAKLGPADLLIANAGVAVPSGVGPEHVNAV